ARHFDAAAVRQVVDQSGVRDVAVDHPWRAGLDAVDDRRAVVLALLQLDLAGTLLLLAKRVPLLDLLLAAARILIQRDVELLDQVRAVALDEPGYVFGEMLAALGHEVAEPLEHLVADQVVLRRPTFGEHAPDLRVEIDAVALELEVEGHVVDTRAEV